MKCYLIDIDETLVKQGVNTPLPGAIEKANGYYDEGHLVYLFSCWPPTKEARNKLKSLGIKFHGMIQKPYADEYVMVDDKLNTDESRKEM